jgi:hypothetical protein
VKDRAPPGRAPKKQPAPPRVKGAPHVCPLCESPRVSGVFIPVLGKTLIGCLDCKKFRMSVPGKAVP